jgi:uroporphyrinogen-III synthase
MSRPVVLNTRPRDQSALLSRLLTEAGFESVEAPAIEIVPAWSFAELEGARRELRAGTFDWVILPSQNAGDFLRHDLSAVRVVCGAATARTLKLETAIKLDRFSAVAALAALKPLIKPGQRVLVPHAAEGRDELLEGLRLLGAEVQALVAYRSAAVTDAAVRMSQGGIDAVTLCSPSAVASLLPALSEQQPVLVCLGETTADAARQAGLRVDGVADKTTMASLVGAVSAAFDARQVPA